MRNFKNLNSEMYTKKFDFWNNRVLSFSKPNAKQLTNFYTEGEKILMSNLQYKLHFFSLGIQLSKSIFINFREKTKILQKFGLESF